MNLSAGWSAALQEAWDAYCAGSYAIGACVIDAQGTVIARGRNRLGEPRGAEGGVISGHDLAHAEVNALLNLKDTPRPECYSWTLLTTLQPCPQCAAIAAMGGMRHVSYAAPDAWIAESNLLTHDPYVSRKGVRVSRAPEPVQRAALRLVLVAHLENGQDPDSPMLRSFASYPDDVHAAVALHASGTLAALRAPRAPLAEALAVLA
ncbi:nucleoside deaminase [Deinococcus sp. LM3]|uniref:nucleoside deaminase n=1 Tax=Deinococcus sp. LM3 TaxID=1938608 RepID=UPI001F0A9771|nr:nucleoside deaminase [Deinococcus sp. LM3]